MKQVIIIRKDLNMRKGKMIAQGAHVSMKALLDIATKSKEIKLEHPIYPNRYITVQEEHICIPLYSDTREWLENKFTKICVSVNSKDELLTIYNKAVEAKLICSLVLDAGFTEFDSPTYTAVAIGPGPNKEIDKITGDLKLL